MIFDDVSVSRFGLQSKLRKITTEIFVRYDRKAILSTAKSWTLMNAYTYSKKYPSIKEIACNVYKRLLKKGKKLVPAKTGRGSGALSDGGTHWK